MSARRAARVSLEDRVEAFRSQDAEGLARLILAIRRREHGMDFTLNDYVPDIARRLAVLVLRARKGGRK